MKYVQTHFWKEHLCALEVFLCALVSQPVCGTGNCELTWTSSLHGGWSGIWTCGPPDARHWTYIWAITPHMYLCKNLWGETFSV